MRPGHPSTTLRLLDHLKQVEGDLHIAAQFECLAATPAHKFVRAALAQVRDTREWLQRNIPVETTAKVPLMSPREQHRAIQKRMARLVP